MADEQINSQQKKTPKAFWKALSWIEIGAIILFAGYLFYLQSSTSLVLNYNNSTEPRVINNIPNPPDTLLYLPNSFVPKSGVSNSQLYIGLALFAVVVLLLIAKRLAELRRATPEEAIKDLDRQIRRLRNVTLGDGRTLVIDDTIDIKITNQFLTRYEQYGDSKPMEFRYSFLVFFKNKKDQMEHYFRAWYHPWTRFWDGFFETKKPIQETDYCPHCGNEYDKKVIPAEDLLRLKQAAGMLRRR